MIDLIIVCVNVLIHDLKAVHNCNTCQQIGNKPRNGRYGACFLSNNSKESSETTILCARPGTRLWVVDLDGNVIQTSQFKVALSCSPTPIFNKYTLQAVPPSDVVLAASTPTHSIVERQPQNLQLAKLQPLFGRYVFAYTKDGFYIFDPCKSSVVLWNDEFRDIQNIKVVNKNSLIIFTTNGRLYTLKIETLEDLFSQMLDDKSYENCMTLLLTHREYFRQKFTDIPLYVICLHKLRSALRALGDCSAYADDLETNFGDVLSLNGNDEQQQQQLASELLSPHTNVIILGTADTQPPKENRTAKSLIDENLKSILISTFSEKFTKNIFNKFNFFNETEEVPQMNDQRISRAKTTVVGDSTTVEPIVAALPNLFAAVIAPNDNEAIVSNDNCRAHDEPDPNRPQPINALLSSVTEKSAEDRLLQNLFMIYKSAAMSNMTLTDRYAHIFDRYDCAGIAHLLEKLELLCIENGESERQARCRCYEMYFNYLSPDIVWELDDESRQFVIDGFVFVNSVNDAAAERCTACAFPILLSDTCVGRSFKYAELGRALFRYLLSRNQLQRCVEIVTAIPQTMTIMCRYAIQEELNVDRLILLLYACDDRQLFDEAVRKYSTDNRLWMKTFEVMISLQNAHRMVCSNCGANNTIARAFDQQDVSVSSLRSWPYVLNVLTEHVGGQGALRLIAKYGQFINCDAIDRVFFLRCLLKP